MADALAPPIPNRDRLRVLAVVAHPDDAELAMGMRIRWHVEQEAVVRVHCLSRGEAAGGQPEQRVQEALSAGAILGVDEYTFSQIPDARFVDAREPIIQELFQVLRQFSPDLVYTHFPQDQHLDHVMTGEAVTVVAMREAASLYYFRSLYSVGFEPNVFFIGGPALLEMKMRALRCFSSQSQIGMDFVADLAAVAHRQFIHHRIIERLSVGTAFSESFRVARQIDCAW
jgi:LmbE family N-acetylglucosaminyl deacetylase